MNDAPKAEPNIPDEVVAKITAHAKSHVEEHGPTHPVHIHLRSELIPAGNELTVPYSETTVKGDKDALLVLVDLSPLSNWGHPVWHMLYDAETGEFLSKAEHDFAVHSYFTDTDNFTVLPSD